MDQEEIFLPEYPDNLLAALEAVAPLCWTTAYNEVKPLAELTDDHLRNLITLLKHTKWEGLRVIPVKWPDGTEVAILPKARWIDILENESYRRETLNSENKEQKLSITVEDLVKELQKFPSTALVCAYTGKGSGISIVEEREEELLELGVVDLKYLKTK